MLRKITLLLMLAGSLATAGCNTMEGAGRDVESAGEVVQEKADANRPGAPAESPR